MFSTFPLRTVALVQTAKVGELGWRECWKFLKSFFSLIAWFKVPSSCYCTVLNLFSSPWCWKGTALPDSQTKLNIVWLSEGELVLAPGRRTGCGCCSGKDGQRLGEGGNRGIKGQFKKGWTSHMGLAEWHFQASGQRKPGEKQEQQNCG